MTKAKTGRPKPDEAAPASKPAPPAGMAGSPAARLWRGPDRAAARSWHLRALVRAETGRAAAGRVVCAARTGLRTRVRGQAWAPASGGAWPDAGSARLRP